MEKVSRSSKAFFLLKSIPYLVVSKRPFICFFKKIIHFSILSVNNLTYLTVAQAVEDIRDFIVAVDRANGIQSQWVIFGQGYAGSLALWYRSKYPSMKIGVVASSAPAYSVLENYRRYSLCCYTNRFSFKIIKSLLTMRTWITIRNALTIIKKQSLSSVNTCNTNEDESFSTIR